MNLGALEESLGNAQELNLFLTLTPDLLTIRRTLQQLFYSKVRATTWSAFHLLEYFGAIPIDERVIDGSCECSSVTAGIDGALRVALLHGEHGLGDSTAHSICAEQQWYASAPPEILKLPDR